MAKVYLVGAGPGDPELITLKGQLALNQADVVLHDHLANEALLDFAPASAERLYVGKKKAEHAMAQSEIVALMVDQARAGKTVVRLKGGDPFIFGRGGEEAEALVKAGIDFEVIPGVTAPLGIAAYCGVPLTHREHTSVVTLITGHDPAKIDWAKVSGLETVIVYMGLTHLPEIAQRMISHGRDPQTPAMAVRWATRADQHVVTAPLADLPARVEEEGLKPPATILIGDVVSLRETIGSWYERLPLFGQRIVLTRAGDQAGDLMQKLRALGAEPISLPVIETVAGDQTALDAAIERLGDYDWLLFTSANGVRHFLTRLDASKQDWRSLRAKICAIGPATRAAVESCHLKVDLMPHEYVAEGVVEAFSAFDFAGKRILLPRAAVARDLIPQELGKRGAKVDVVEAYRTIVPKDAPERARQVLSHKPDWVTFTSSSTVKNFLTVAGRDALDGVRIATIGPVTSQTARKHGLPVAAEAREYTMDGLIGALLERASKA